jgi:hypothetical protein
MIKMAMPLPGDSLKPNRSEQINKTELIAKDVKRRIYVEEYEEYIGEEVWGKRPA